MPTSKEDMRQTTSLPDVVEEDNIRGFMDRGMGGKRVSCTEHLVLTCHRVYLLSKSSLNTIPIKAGAVVFTLIS